MTHEPKIHLNIDDDCKTMCGRCFLVGEKSVITRDFNKVTCNRCKKLAEATPTARRLKRLKKSASADELMRLFPVGTRLIIDVVFPSEYRIGFEYKNRKFLPESGKYFDLKTALRYCLSAFFEHQQKEKTE